MEHVTACYWQKETVPNIFLSLQQRKYRRRKASVVYACISDNRELLMNLQNKIEEELQGRDIWKSYTEERIREKWSKQLAAVDKNSNYAGVLCVDSRVLLFESLRIFQEVWENRMESLEGSVHGGGSRSRNSNFADGSWIPELL